ncbi:hypothetical protein [Hahella sp. HN01]|uniref:hypothetical protein n=1 Tax=Hahella sp. HN01 TaxID=2847262 RepID=UPI001C1F1F08|nr:hypothetical protein [Hahella sp. HN01]MBU6955972.1 hypothetical protein [Hahella sp. HN01]
MMDQKYNPITDTILGKIEGRDAIGKVVTVVDDIASKFSLNVNVNNMDVTFEFESCMAMKRMLIDFWLYDDLNPNLLKSTCFFEVVDSLWIKGMYGADEAGLKHIVVQTYDFVYEFACKGYDVRYGHV